MKNRYLATGIWPVLICVMRLADFLGMFATNLMNLVDRAWIARLIRPDLLCFLLEFASEGSYCRLGRGLISRSKSLEALELFFVMALLANWKPLRVDALQSGVS